MCFNMLVSMMHLRSLSLNGITYISILLCVALAAKKNVVFPRVLKLKHYYNLGKIYMSYSTYSLYKLYIKFESFLMNFIK